MRESNPRHRGENPVSVPLDQRAVRSRRDSNPRSSPRQGAALATGPREQSTPARTRTWIPAVRSRRLCPVELQRFGGADGHRTRCFGLEDRRVRRVHYDPVVVRGGVEPPQPRRLGYNQEGSPRAQPHRFGPLGRRAVMCAPLWSCQSTHCPEMGSVKRRREESNPRETGLESVPLPQLTDIEELFSGSTK